MVLLSKRSKKTMLIIFHNSLDLNKKNVTIALALFDLMPPSAVKTDKRWTPSALDAKNICIKIISNTTRNTQREITKAETVCDLKKFNYHPMIFVIVTNLNKITKSFDDIEEIVVSFRDVRFTFKNFLLALDATFMIFNILGVKYPPHCIKFWTFIDESFYKIHSNKNITSSVRSKVLSTNLRISPALQIFCLYVHHWFVYLLAINYPSIRA